ncbi:MAG: M50 family metallopeptidase [Candidatus Hodarchaeales archaeon]
MFSFSEEERNQLIIASLIFIFVELSLFIDGYPFTIFDLGIIAILSFPLFLLHEIGHKFIAIRHGFSSRFYLDQKMALFSLISIFFPIKIIAPGAVIFYGTPSEESEASIAMAGPLVNIILGGILLGVSFFLSPNWMIFTLLVSKFSFDLALFNLLPISILDGAKIRKWNLNVFLVIFIFTLTAWLFHPFGLLGGL